MKTAEHQILTRIGFAERWLQRAREECLDGDVGRGLLTLVLADAEVRRLLQLAVPAAPKAHSRRLPVMATVIGLFVAAAVALPLGVPALRAASVEPAALAPGLLLRPGTGALLVPIDASVAEAPVPAVTVPTLPAAATPVRVARRSLRPAAEAASPGQSRVTEARPAPTPQPAPPRVVVSSPTPQTPALTPAPVVVPAVTPVPAPSATPSVADLLDLVIVADRTLRRSQP